MLANNMAAGSQEARNKFVSNFNFDCNFVLLSSAWGGDFFFEPGDTQGKQSSGNLHIFLRREFLEGVFLGRT